VSGGILVVFGSEAPSEGGKILQALSEKFANLTGRFDALAPDEDQNSPENAKVFVVVVASRQARSESAILTTAISTAKRTGAMVFPVLVRNGSLPAGLSGIQESIPASELLWDAAMKKLIERVEKVVVPAPSNTATRVLNSTLAVFLFLWAVGWASAVTGLSLVKNAWADATVFGVIGAFVAAQFPKTDWAEMLRTLIGARWMTPVLLVSIVVFGALVLYTPVLVIENASDKEVMVSVLKDPQNGTVGTEALRPDLKAFRLAKKAKPIPLWLNGATVHVQIALPNLPVVSKATGSYLGFQSWFDEAALPTTYTYTGSADERRIIFLVDQGSVRNLRWGGARPITLRLSGTMRIGPPVDIDVKEYSGQPVIITCAAPSGTEVHLTPSSKDLQSCPEVVQDLNATTETIDRPCDLPNIRELYYTSPNNITQKAFQGSDNTVFCGKGLK